MSNQHEIRRWFCAEVLPLEAYLVNFLRRNGVMESEIGDMRQDIYEHAIRGATRAFPDHPKAYLHAIARNLLINRARRARIVSFQYMAPWDVPEGDDDQLTPERHVDARAELGRVDAGMQRLPPRCREAIRLRKVEGLSIKETAQRMKIGTDAVVQQTTLGMRALVDFMQGGEARIERRGEAGRRAKGKAR